jgi:hypothetical protein
MLFALPGYQFPYTVMNRCLYLRVRGRKGEAMRRGSSDPTQISAHYLSLAFWITA